MNPLPLRFVLADSPWPRTGGDRRNSGRVSIDGPVHGRLALEVALPDPVADGRRWRGGGVAIGADGVLVVVSDGRLARIGLAGQILAIASIPMPGPDPVVGQGEDDNGEDGGDGGDDPVDEAPTGPRPQVLAPPVALADGGAVVLASSDLLVFDPRGELVGGELAIGSADDSVLSPNLTRGGALVLTHMTGEVEWFVDGRRRKIGNFGYDVVPPALFDDDAMAIAGYAGAGFVCVGPDGTRRWRIKLDADMLPAIDSDGFAAAGSQNEKRSIIVAPDGSVAGTVDGAAVFAEGPNGDWFTRFRAGLARVRRDGSRVWTVACQLSPELRWGAQAPIADASGRVYVLAADELLALDGETGSEIFRVPLGGPPRSALALVAPGLCAVVLERRLVLIE